jgi:hypothetical protein
MNISIFVTQMAEAFQTSAASSKTKRGAKAPRSFAASKAG